MAFLCTAVHVNDYRQVPWRWRVEWEESFCSKLLFLLQTLESKTKEYLEWGSSALLTGKARRHQLCLSVLGPFLYDPHNPQWQEEPWSVLAFILGRKFLCKRRHISHLLIFPAFLDGSADLQIYHLHNILILLTKATETNSNIWWPWNHIYGIH